MIFGAKAWLLSFLQIMFGAKTCLLSFLSFYRDTFFCHFSDEASGKMVGFVFCTPFEI